MEKVDKENAVMMQKLAGNMHTIFPQKSAPFDRVPPQMKAP